MVALALPTTAWSAPPPEPTVTPSTGPSVAMQQRRNRQLVIAGTVLTVVSVAAYVVLAAGLVVRANASDDLRSIDPVEEPELSDEKEQLERRGSLTAIIGGSIAGAAMVSGLPLIIVGRYRQRKLLERSQAAPVALRGGGGLSWRVRF